MSCSLVFFLSFQGKELVLEVIAASVSFEEPVEKKRITLRLLDIQPPFMVNVFLSAL